LSAPNLKVSNRAFVIPKELTANGETIRPDEIVEKERRMQLLAALLTAGGAVGLAICYREVLISSFQRRTHAGGIPGGQGSDERPLPQATTNKELL
jgi:hypothetical protein